MQEQEKDFLQGYEIRNLLVNPRMYRFFAIAAVINLIGLFAIGQSNMLSRSACESPFVNRICSVLDTVYFSSKLMTADTGYVVKEYEETKIKDSDVVWIDQTNVEPSLSYPVGYFQIANRDELAMMQQDLEAFPLDPLSPITPPPPPIIPPSRTNNDPIMKPRPLPKTNGSLVDGDFDDSDNDEKKPGGEEVADNGKPDDDPESTPGVNDREVKPLPATAPEIEINKQPLYDFVDGVVAKVSDKRVDLQRPFKVAMVARIDEKGKLDVEKSRWLTEEEEGDPDMILVAKDAVEKIGDSGWMWYLTEAGINDVRIVFYQDEDKLAAEVVALMPNEARAKSLSSQFSTWLSTALFAHNNNIKKLEDDVITLMRAASFETEKNRLKIKFNLEKEVAHPIINTRLREYQAEKERKRLEGEKPGQPNGSIEKSNAGNRAER
ncbi:MAG: hypothetical protein DWQ47_12250 [Acidobacteria bacterium]|nr:MAG: hypothetical protein DWQ32_14665 [Acidobacteriota bacterium]REJ98340.1 MAG: hypothetical protein DWQ38_17465 [Acidobacteriota bacterium]REK17084.1 MAG: hypothetical protein DWQ43_02510 [Acidobacteriota bacterium]REK42994.1 MAG: hypothetical protein DWQ47_12250 [Acidobacteriota bacterium]